VIVNISQHGSHALIVTPAKGPNPDPAVLVVDLPTASRGTVIDQAFTLLTALGRIGGPVPDSQTRETDRDAAFDVLAWSWRAVTEPVLTALGYTRTPDGRVEDWPRVWWCPTGPATVLPLHAAGDHPRTTAQYAAVGEAAALADSVAGRVISSYTPTLTALTRARTRPGPGRVRLLAVGVPEAPSYIPGASSLPAVRSELQTVASYLPPPGHATHLLGVAATRRAVLEALPSHSWLHLSCHGVQHRADASLSAFLLYDQQLTLADLAALNLREADMAYLSACQTATGDVRLLDEALHLAGALQLVGYRHVLATLWNISDAAAPAMADVTYARLLHPDPDHPEPADRPHAARAPYALHHAVSRLRHAHPDEPLLWASYIHLGP
jgi:CHAT domain-containing protein